MTPMSFNIRDLCVGGSLCGLFLMTVKNCKPYVDFHLAYRSGLKTRLRAFFFFQLKNKLFAHFLLFVLKFLGILLTF